MSAVKDKQIYEQSQSADYGQLTTGLPDTQTTENNGIAAQKIISTTTKFQNEGQNSGQQENDVHFVHSATDQPQAQHLSTHAQPNSNELTTKKNLQKVDGIQLTINLDDGRTVSIVQEIGDYKFSVGDLVEVISTKGKTRVSPSGIN